MHDSSREAPPAGAPFPLPLTTFEAYYLADDRPDYPTTFPIELRFSGRLNRELFALALSQAVAIHPLFTARLEGDKKRLRWVSGPNRPPWLDWAEDAPIAHRAGEFIDLHLSCGLRTWVRISEHTSRVLMQFHHACCDGLAGMRFVEDLLVFYTIAVKGGHDITPPRRSIGRLSQRDMLKANPKPSLLAFPRDLCVTAWLWWRILFGRSAPLAPPVRTGPPALPGKSQNQPVKPPTLLEFDTAVLDRVQTAALHRAASEQGVTVNDLLLRAMFLTLRDWNLAHPKPPRGKLRLNVPVNVRPKGFSDMPAVNGVGFAFVSARKRDFASPDLLLERVRRQMDRIKDWKLGLYFLGGLGVARKIRGAVPWALSRKRSFATMVLSNLGPVFHPSPLERADGRLECGDVVLERVTGVPPIRPMTRGAAAVMEYAGEMILSLRCDPRYFDRAQTRQLLDAYIARVTRS